MNNFNIILTKTESHLKGVSRKFRKWGGGGICWTLASYILLRILQAKIAKFHRQKGGRKILRPPLNQPMHYLHWNIILFHHLRAVKNPVWQFTGKVWQFDVSSNVNVEGKSFSVCSSFPGNYYKLDFACATLKILLLNERKQVFGWLSLNPEMISTQI